MIDVVVHSDVFGVVVVVVADAEGADSVLPTLPEGERALMGAWAERRQRTFALGRFALRGALAEAGVDVDGVIGRDDRGAPVLPHTAGALSDVKLSVSHKDRVSPDGTVWIVAAGLVSRDERGAAVGIDVELIEGQSRARIDKLAAQTLTPEELATLPDEDEPRRRAVLTRFSLKEALYKGLDPHVRRYVGFQEVSVVDDALGYFCDVRAVGAFNARGRVVDIAVPAHGVDVIVTAARVIPR